MSKLVNWGRLIATCYLIAQTVTSLEFASEMISRLHGWNEQPRFILGLVAAIWIVGTYFAVAWGIWRFSAGAYWLLALLSVLTLVSNALKIIFGHAQEFPGSQWTYLVVCLIALVWLSLPPVYEKYVRRNQTA